MSNEDSTERLEAERAKVADRLEAMARWMPVVMIPIALVALVDLATGWGADDRVIDLVLLGVVAFVIVDSFWLRRLARRMRSGEPSPRPTVLRVTASLAGLMVVLIAGGALGYLIGGWATAVAIPLATVLLMSGSVAVGIRKRRRILAGR